MKLIDVESLITVKYENCRIVYLKRNINSKGIVNAILFYGNGEQKHVFFDVVHGYITGEAKN